MKNSNLLFPAFLILFISFLIIGDISIVVQSENNRDVEVIALNQTSMGNVSNGVALEVPYDNYIVKLPSNMSASVSYSSFWSFLDGTTGKIVYFIIIIFIMWLVIAFVRSMQ